MSLVGGTHAGTKTSSDASCLVGQYKAEWDTLATNVWYCSANTDFPNNALNHFWSPWKKQDSSTVAAPSSDSRLPLFNPSRD